MESTAPARFKRELIELISLAVVVGFVYSIPLLLSMWHTGAVLDFAFPDEHIYMARIVGAFHHESLASPYLAGHDTAPRFMPEMTERTLAFLAHWIHVSPFV